MHSEYLHLRLDRLTQTADDLAERITKRFPDSALGKIAQTVAAVTRGAIATSEKINRPNWRLRAALITLTLFTLAGAVVVGITLVPEEKGSALAFISDYLVKAQGAVIFLSAIVVFFWTLETRFKRGKAVKAIHELRGLAHIIDMHQLSKGPQSSTVGGVPYSYEGLKLYLDYCNELLGIISKIGQLYVEDFRDSTTLAAVQQLENLTTGLSQKIWQKLMILEYIRSEATEQTSK